MSNVSLSVCRMYRINLPSKEEFVLHSKFSKYIICVSAAYFVVFLEYLDNIQEIQRTLIFTTSKQYSPQFARFSISIYRRQHLYPRLLQTASIIQYAAFKQPSFQENTLWLDCWKSEREIVRGKSWLSCFPSTREKCENTFTGQMSSIYLRRLFSALFVRI